MEELNNVNEVMITENTGEIVETIEEVTNGNGGIGKIAIGVGGALGLGAGVYFGIKKGIPAIKKWNRDRQIKKLKKAGYTIDEPLEIIDIDIDEEYPIDESK